MKTRKFTNSLTAFSLVELMIVVGIIGILAALVTFQYKIYVAKSRQAEAKLNLKAIFTMMDTYRTEHGRLASGSLCLTTSDVSTETSCLTSNAYGFKILNCKNARYTYIGPNAFEFEIAGRRTVYEGGCPTAVDAWTGAAGTVLKLFDSTTDACVDLGSVLMAKFMATYRTTDMLNDYDGNNYVDNNDFNILVNFFSLGC